MTVDRTIAIPYPQNITDWDRLNEYLLRLYRATKEESSKRITDFTYMNVSNLPWIDVTHHGAAGDGSKDDTGAFQEAIDSLTSGGVVLIPEGNYVFSDTLTLNAGIILQGIGKGGTTLTKLNFNGLTNASPAIHINDVDDVQIRNVALSGRASGSGNEIQIDGYVSQILLDGVEINTATTGDAVHVTTSTIASTFRMVHTIGGTRGFYTGASTTSLGLYNCYANRAEADTSSSTGFMIQGTYISLNSCAADWNWRGYAIHNASQIGLYNCGSEFCDRNAVDIDTSNGVTLIGFRSHANNMSESIYYPSFADILGGSDYLTFIDCRDSEPRGSGGYSMRSTDGTIGSNVLIVNPQMEKTIIDGYIDLSPRISSGSFYLGGKRHYYGTAAPTTGTWAEGDTAWNTTPGTLGTPGWMCTVAGTPGTWKQMGSLS